ncbi:MAG: phenylalanine--tRNA ligase beta subunit-related protein [Planctomycetota bacterium]
MTAWLDRATANLPDFRSRIGLAHFGRVTVAPSSDALRDEIATAIASMLQQGDDWPVTPDEWSKGVRGLLRQSGFRPTGRAKPASEYLLRTLAESREFTFINNLVDINNLLSLQTFLPMSVLDASEFRGALQMRIAQAGERYVFNQAGHEIDLKDLLVVADTMDDGGPSRPLGNPIKDSMAGKLRDTTPSAVAIVYAPLEMVDEAAMATILADWVRLVEAHAGGAESSTRQLTT